VTGPETRPASVVHPSWGVNVGHGAHHDPTEVDEEPLTEPAHMSATPIVIIAAMVCLTFCVLIVSLFGDPRAGAVLAGGTVVIGCGLALLFRKHWLP
jgi:hypothetical protein